MMNWRKALLLFSMLPLPNSVSSCFFLWIAQCNAGLLFSLAEVQQLGQEPKKTKDTSVKGETERQMTTRKAQQILSML